MRDIIFIGDGLGVRSLPAKVLGLDVLGTDISKWAIEHSYCKDNMILDDISNTKLIEIGEKAKVVVLYDILEHLNDEQLETSLSNILKLSDNFVISVPVIGDPNLLNDKTHKQFHETQWWINKISSFGLIQEPTPEYWLFKNQILIFRK